MARVRFLFKTLTRLLCAADSTCPHCRSASTHILGRKHAVLELRRCRECSLMFRYPKETRQSSYAYYQQGYRENGLTTDLPDEARLRTLLASGFAKTGKDLSAKIGLLRRSKPEGRVLDFGCSWGYGTWQLRRAGYDCLGFEISRPRAHFGRRKLGLRIVDSPTALASLPAASFDLVFANHVLEHLPDLFSVFHLTRRLLKHDGLLAVFVPNCTGCSDAKIFQAKKSYAFGEKHCMAFDRAFFEANLPRYGFEPRCLTSPYEGTADPFLANDRTFEVQSAELCALGKREPAS